ncbi:MAG: DUF309 domain-containing protein [Candidatus Omnitrophica bacterium]|nr:DUF309 domain-containing protein [Candidatus Omnitrophota bacterium]
MEIDARLEKGIELFNRGEFFEAHEAIEELWRETDGELKNFYRGLIQTAASLHHLKRGTIKGGLSVCDAAVYLLKPYAPHALGLNVEKLINDLTLCFVPFREEPKQKFDSKNLQFPKIEFNL